MDFTTALARLLRDGTLRQAFASDAAAVAEALGLLAGTERTAFVQLWPADLEAQARVLIRKRYREVESHLPVTCAAHEARGWRLFQDFAPIAWPVSSAADALAFCEWLRARSKFVDRREMNRVRFDTHGKRFAVHLVAGPKAPGKIWSLPRGQVLIRRGPRVAEIALRLGW